MEVAMLDHELRRGRITSSTIAAVLGIDPWTTQLGAWAKIRDPSHHDNTPQFDADKLDHYTRGHILESALLRYGALALAADKNATVVMELPGTVPHPSAPWAADTIDAVYHVQQDGMRYGAEAKTVAWSDPDAKQWGEPWTDQIPPHVRVQCDWHLWHHPELRSCIVPTLIGSGLTMRCYVAMRDDERIAEIVEYASAWHTRYIVGDELPDPVAGDLGVVRKAFATVLDDEVESTPMIEALARDDVALRIQIADLEKHREDVRARLAVAMRLGNVCEGDWGRVTFRKSRDGETVDWKAIAWELYAEMRAEQLEPLAPDHRENEKALVDLFDDTIKRHTKPKKGTRSLRTHVPSVAGDDDA
jgi:hypothetical protein